jgi:Smg protein
MCRFGVERITMMPVAAQDLLPCGDLRGTMTIRVLGPHERGRFAPEAWGHLLALSGAGALDPAELEQVIERAMLQFDGRIALDDLRAMMEGAGFDRDSAADSPTVH